MNWSEITKETACMMKFMKRRSIGKWNQWRPRDLKCYCAARIVKTINSVKGVTKPYKIYNKKCLIERILRANAGSAFIKYKSIIRLTINAVARKYYDEHKVSHKHANTVGILEIREMANKMFKEGDVRNKTFSFIFLNSSRGNFPGGGAKHSTGCICHIITRTYILTEGELQYTTQP